MSTYKTDTRHRLQAAQRFFARLIGFDLECPHCGTVYQIRPRKADANWDPYTGRFHCTLRGCGRVYVLGILAWPIQRAHQVASATPEDQVPSPRQVAQLRKEGGGWWMPEGDAIKHKRPFETNLTTEEERPEDDETED